MELLVACPQNGNEGPFHSLSKGFADEGEVLSEDHEMVFHDINSAKGPFKSRSFRLESSWPKVS